MLATVIRSKEVAGVDDGEIQFPVVIEILCDNTGRIGADRITNRIRELNRTRRALVYEDRNSAISQIRNCDIGLVISFAISAEVS